MAKKQLKGKVVSDKMEKTVVVRVEGNRYHPKYKKRYSYTKKYKAHDEKKKCKVGDDVLIEECRPISKEKRWRIVEKLTTQAREEFEKQENLPEEGKKEEIKPPSGV